MSKAVERRNQRDQDLDHGLRLGRQGPRTGFLDTGWLKSDSRRGEHQLAARSCNDTFPWIKEVMLWRAPSESILFHLPIRWDDRRRLQ